MRAAPSFASLVVLGVALVALPAAAEEPGPRDESLAASAPLPHPARRPVFRPSLDEIEETGRRWYGWQMLLGYGVSDVLLVVSIPTADAGALGATLAIASLSGHVFVGPIAHWAHGHVERGFGSLGLAVGGAAVGAAIALGVGVATQNNRGDVGSSNVILGPLFGGGIGLISANVVDTALLPYDPAAEKPAFVGSLQIVPIVAPKRGGVVVAGTF